MQLEKEINIVGISMVTSNEAAFKENTIGKLWEEFFKSSIHEKLNNNIASSSIFSVYSDYENGYIDKYKITIGYGVKDVNHIPNGLNKVTIPAGKYETFECKSNSPEDIINTWKMIWQLDTNTLKPNFITTFEEYKDNDKVIIYIGHD